MSKHDGYGSELAILLVFWFSLAAALGRGWVAGVAVVIVGIPAVKMVSLVLSTSARPSHLPASQELAAARIRQRLETDGRDATPAAA